MSMEAACIITCALSGAVAGKQQCGGIPYTPEEYAKEVRRARDAGASMVHIHAREPNGSPTVRPEHYRAITRAVLAEAPDIIVNYSTGWVGLPMQERVAHITELKPEIGALNMGSMNYAKYSPKRKGFVFNFVFENNFDDIVFLLERMNEAGVKPECECFDVGHVESVEPLVDLGVIRRPIQFSLIHGVLGGIRATARNLAHMASVVPEGCTWGVIAVGREQWMMVAASAALGGNVRVGFEDNFYLPSEEMASSNGELVDAAAQIVRLQGREVAEPGEARRLLGLASEPDRSNVLAQMLQVLAEMVANVWKVVVAPGDVVREGDPLVVLESMKMEIPVESPVTGMVAEVRVQEGGIVQEGDVIAVIEQMALVRVELSAAPHVIRVMLDRPDRRNAIARRMLEERERRPPIYEGT